MNLRKMERYLRVNLLGPGPRLVKKELTGPRSHKFWETLDYGMSTWAVLWGSVAIFRSQNGAASPPKKVWEILQYANCREASTALGSKWIPSVLKSRSEELLNTTDVSAKLHRLHKGCPNNGRQANGDTKISYYSVWCLWALRTELASFSPSGA